MNLVTHLAQIRATIMVVRVIASAPLLIASGMCREAGLIVAGSDARLSWRYVLGAA